MEVEKSMDSLKYIQDTTPSNIAFILQKGKEEFRKKFQLLLNIYMINT